MESRRHKANPGAAFCDPCRLLSARIRGSAQVRSLFSVGPEPESKLPRKGDSSRFGVHLAFPVKALRPGCV